MTGEQIVERKEIAFQELRINALDIWPNQWFVLGSGDFLCGEFNAMTVSWGSMGVFWRRPFVQVGVRPQRFTYEFMENIHEFSICAFPPELKKSLNFLGTHSGREGEKIVRSGLHPLAAKRIAPPVFMEAELIIECRKMYWEDVKPSNFFDPDIDKDYPGQDYHRLYWGEIVYIEGTDKYKQ